MATEFTCITRKIEVHLHRHGDSEEAKQRMEKEKNDWKYINDNLYKVANVITSHLFFNDAFVERLKVQSNEYRSIKELLDETSDKKEIKQLESRKKALDKEFIRQKNTFLKGGDENEKGSAETAVRRFAVEKFPKIPYAIINSLTNQVVKTYNKFEYEVTIGKRTIPNYKKGIPVPFLMKTTNNIALRKREDGSIYVLFPGKLEWDLHFGKKQQNEREIIERIFRGEYKACDSSIQELNKQKRILLLVVQIPRKENKLNPNKIVGVDLGINVPLYAALNDNEYGGMSIGSREQFLKVRLGMQAQKRKLQRDLRHSTNGGHGRKQKLQALERLEGKERNWVHLQNHIFSKAVIEFALKNNAGVIQMENLFGFGRDGNNEIKTENKFILRNWSYSEVQRMIEYKADAVGIKVRYIDPYHTSQTCSFCGHYEKGQRERQPVFICKNPECKKGKGKLKADGTYEGINADWNAARNIALSDKVVDKKKN